MSVCHSRPRTGQDRGEPPGSGEASGFITLSLAITNADHRGRGKHLSSPTSGSQGRGREIRAQHAVGPS